MRMAMMLSSESAVLFRPPALSYSSNHSRLPSRNPSPTLSFPLVNPRKNFDLHITTTAAATKQFRVKASISSQCPQNPTLRSSMPGSTETVNTPPTNLTRTITTIASLAFALTRLLLTSLKIFPILPNPSLACAAGSLFFAAVDYRANPYLNTPLTVVATGLAWWLDIYSGVLMLRVLLSWFPNIPWDRQPLSAIRDLCDPYLNLFRNIIPPVFDTLDISPLLAFAILGFLGPILRSSR